MLDHIQAEHRLLRVSDGADLALAVTQPAKATGYPGSTGEYDPWEDLGIGWVRRI